MNVPRLETPADLMHWAGQLVFWLERALAGSDIQPLRTLLYAPGALPPAKGGVRLVLLAEPTGPTLVASDGSVWRPLGDNVVVT